MSVFFGLVWFVTLIAFVAFWWKKRNARMNAGEGYQGDADYLAKSKIKRILGAVSAVSFVLMLVTSPSSGSDTKTSTDTKTVAVKTDETPEQKAEREKKEAEEKKAAEEKAAAEKKAKEEREAAEKKAKEEKAAAEKRAKEEKARNEKNIDVVKNGNFYSHPNVPVGAAFRSFFSNGKWSAFTSTENQQIVEFSGKCTWFNEPAVLTMQFIVNGNEFEMGHVNIDGNAMNYADSVDILDKILNEY